MTLDIKGELSRVHELYNSTKAQSCFNLLLYGKAGTGKTTFLTTCPKPVLIHSFDPGGTKSIQHLLGPETGIYAKSFEGDTYTNARQYAAWVDEMTRLERAGIFTELGTYCVDSYTFLYLAIMNQTLKTVKTGRIKDDIPAQTDYRVAQTRLQQNLTDCTSYPCNFVLTAHVLSEQDGVTGAIDNTLSASPKIRVFLPQLFDEMFYASTKVGSKGIEYQIQTQNDGLYVCKTRIGKNGNLDRIEPQNMKELLKKAGLSVSDKEWK